MDNILTQWVEDIKYRENEEPSRLDLVFTKEPEILENLVYKSPLRKSDHVLNESNLKGEPEEARREDYIEGRYNYSKANFAELKRHFEQEGLTTFYRAEKTEDTWRILLEKYNERIRKHVPKKRMNKSGNNEWFNRRCELAKMEREKVWNGWRRNKRHNLWMMYVNKRNEYVKIRIEE